MKHYDFNKKTVLLTGSSGGLGSALAMELAQRGARLILTARSRTALDELRAGLPEGADADVITADLTRPGEVEGLVRSALERHEAIDALVNNAGRGYFSLMEEADEETVRSLFELNTFAPLALIQALVPGMKSRGGGRIVNIVSAAGRVPIPSVGVYGGSKSALAVMANTMRLELAHAGVDVLNIYPGVIDTAFEENALSEGGRQGLCPREHCGEPRLEVAREVARAAEGPPGEIWLERESKWLSAAALLAPRWLDNRLSRLTTRVVEKKPVKPRRWRLVQIESALVCNLKCIMCPWRDLARELPTQGIRGMMSPEVWEALRPFLGDIQSLDFTGGGEPLLQPLLVDWVREAHEAGCETGVLTNGTLLTEDKSRQLMAAGIDWICVSLDGANAEIYEKIRLGARFDVVRDNIARLTASRTGPRPKVMINFVLMEINFHQVDEMVSLAGELGVDQINFKQCDVIRGDRGKGLGLFGRWESRGIRRKEKALARARRRAKKAGLVTTAFAWVPEEQPVCPQDPRDSLFIRHDGRAAPCINLALGGSATFLDKEVEMPTVHYGSLPDQDLMTLWETETCRSYRRRFEDRSEAYERGFMNSPLEASPTKLNEALENAREAMPAPPDGCGVCHYLYNL